MNKTQFQDNVIRGYAAVRTTVNNGIDKFLDTGDKVMDKMEFISDLVRAEHRMRDEKPDLYAELPGLIETLTDMDKTPSEIVADLYRLRQAEKE